jgi:tetratricopeptide (TPR) repeat protein
VGPHPRRAARLLFDPGAAAARAAELGAAAPEAELLAPLSVVVALLENPERVEVRRLVHACRRVSGWAEGQGALGTALEFAQAAALAAADDASLAVAVGRLARRRAEYDRAESWYLRAIVLGRQRRDWRSYALGYLGLGSVHMQKGNYPAARRMLHRALRAATRRAVAEVRGMACHDLFACEIETGKGLEASAPRHGSGARLRPSDPRVARLAYDVAYHWVLLDTSTPPCAWRRRSSRTRTSGAAGGGAGDRPGTGGPRRRRRRKPGRVRERRTRDGRGAGPLRTRAGRGRGARERLRRLLGLAYGACSLGERELAIVSAERALQLAVRRQQGVWCLRRRRRWNRCDGTSFRNPPWSGRVPETRMDSRTTW